MNLVLKLIKRELTLISDREQLIIRSRRDALEQRERAPLFLDRSGKPVPRQAVAREKCEDSGRFASTHECGAIEH